MTSLDHVQLAAPPGCEAEARRFYSELFGLEEIEKPEGVRVSGGAWFTVGSQELHIGVEEEFVPARKAHPGIRVDAQEIDALAGRLSAAGAPVAWDDRLTDRRRFFTEDPWGNRIEVLAYTE